MNEFRDLQAKLSCDDYTMLCLISNWLRVRPELLTEILLELDEVDDLEDEE